MAEITAVVSHSTPGGDDDPGTPSRAVLAQLEAVEICRDVYEGTLRLRQQGRKYLPQFPKEEDEAYSARLGRAVLFNAYRKTIKGLTGMVFRKDPSIGEDVPPQIRPHLENIDLAGRDVAMFAQDAFLSKLIDGHGVILVDWHGPEGARSSADEAEARPYWVWIEKGQVIRFRTRSENGAIVVESFAYLETDTIRKGEFGEQVIERIRQYDLTPEGRVSFRSWTRNVDEGKGEWVPEETGKLLGPRMTRIPIAVDYAGRKGVLVSEPPLLDLAIENLEHYDVRSDRRASLKIGTVPVFVTKGVEADSIQTFTVGPAIGLALPGEGMDAKYVEIQGTAYDASRQELQDIEQRMAALGLSMLQRQSRAAETAQAKRLDKAEENSELGNFARATDVALKEALHLHAMWMGLSEGGSISVNRDFDHEPLDPAVLNALSKMVGAGQLSIETMWDIMIRGELLPETFDPEVEQQRIQQGGAAELVAAVEAARREQMRQGNPPPDDDDEDPEGDGRAA